MTITAKINPSVTEVTLQNENTNITIDVKKR